MVLWGKANSGKTGMLRLLIELFSQVKEYKVKGLAKNDRCVVVELNGKMVGIITAGDTAKELEAGFSELPECDVYVCASRTKDGTVDFVRRMSKGQGLLWVEKWAVSEEECIGINVKKRQEKANRIQAEEIYDILDELTKSPLSKSGKEKC